MQNGALYFINIRTARGAWCPLFNKPVGVTANWRLTWNSERCIMVELREVTQENFYDCIALNRASNLYVGDAEAVLAEAYIFRESSTAYAICDGEVTVGLVIIMDRPEEKNDSYSFTDLFIADNFQGKKYGNQAVEAIIRKFKEEKKRNRAELQVHNSNMTAKRIYEKHGFVKVGNAQWDESFEIMQLFL